MSDRRAVSAGHLAGASVAAAGEPWRVAVGGNRVQSMTVEQIAYAFSAGQLSVRTPLWPPGTSGWQALGNFEQFQSGAQPPNGNYGQLAQFEEADDDPTRMWTGSNDLSELPGMELPEMLPDMMPMPAEPSLAPQSRPSARTGPRQVASRPPPRSAPAQPPVARVSSAAQPALRSGRPKRGSGVWLVAGLVGLVGLGSAVLAARGNWSAEAPSTDVAANEATAPQAAPAETEAPPAAVPAAEGEPNQARLAKYEDTQPSAFVAEAEPKRATEASLAAAGAALAEAKPAPADAPTAAVEAPAPVKAVASRPKARVSSTTAKRSTTAASTASAKPKPAAEPTEPRQPPKEKEAAKEKEPAKAETAAAAAPAASSAVNEAAATALGNAAKLASSCRPRGGPSGAGKARVIYSPDGEVQSVEILTAKFRDTLTASCVRMVFRRAKIPAFKGEPPTFIKSFTIPEE